MRFSILVLAMLAAGVAPYPEAAVASCTGPYLSVESDAELVRGATTTVEGRAFVDGCADSIGCSETFGCQHCTVDDPETPQQDVLLQLVQRGRTWDLGTVDAGTADDNHLGWTSWTFVVPADASPGRARLVASTAQPVPVTLD